MPRILHAQRTEREPITPYIASMWLTFKHQNSTKKSSLRWEKWASLDLPFKDMAARVSAALRMASLHVRSNGACPSPLTTERFRFVN